MAVMTPTVSVVIPAYNAQAFITETIESVLAQSYQDFEIIVVDDGSVDETGSLVKQYGHPVRYIHTENKGPSHARNTGIRASEGKYIAFLDADDLWITDKLKVQVEFLEQKQSIGFVFADMLMFRNDQVTMASYFNSLKDPIVRSQIPCKNDVIANPTRVLLKCNVIPTGTVLVRKSCLNRTTLFDEKINNVEDLDLWIRLSMLCDFGCIPRVLKRKRDHQNNISKHRRKALEGAIYVYEKLSREYSCNGKYVNDYKRLLSRRYGTLGYLFFSEDNKKKARPCFIKSLRYGFTSRIALFLCASFLPVGIIKIIRRIKSIDLKKRLLD